MSASSGKNARIALLLSGIVFGMVGVSFAAVPLYELFCQVTGFGGTTQRAEAGAEAVSERRMNVRFNADVNGDLPWSFAAEEREVTVRVGENRLTFYKARNEADQAITGVATFNVTPTKAGQYFNKVACFCFTEQTLQPGQEMEMGVSFFVDPAIEEDPNLDNVKTITLSYTFFRSLDEIEDPGEETEISRREDSSGKTGRVAKAN
ncbi:cytochrome c oxidase assembly protein [Fodinicurvata fenggangensis]|uniref:cytochrome c oxidase assembly protein n=1 Tax=Fodinicurvata fenggangensis TaxID=1121830 RepID=UPI00068CF3F8|nr:cytochrome c oxidase assembly protein [Fodinicurvata fenggangensis]